MSLNLPENHQQYYEGIVERSEKYIKLGYWSEIDLATLHGWLNNFNTKEEKYFSALILDKLVYRNEMTIKSMFSKLFHINLPNILEDKNIYLNQTSLEEWEKLLRKPKKESNLPFRFTTITSENELGDSGADFMRRLRRYYLVNRELIIRIDKKKESEVNTLIVIDDLIASGEQTITFIEDNIDMINQYRYIIFMPLMGNSIGINKVKEKIKKLEYMEQLNEDIIFIKPVEVILENDSFFYEKQNTYKIDGKNTIEDLKNFYQNFIKSKIKTSEIFGHGNLSLVLIFSSGIPDNTLPIIYEDNEDTNWKALYEKF